MRLMCIAGLFWFAAFVHAIPAPHEQSSTRDRHIAFEPAGTCLACHNGLTSASGEDISIGSDWRGSIMANSARDPYWQASVRRETLDHPDAAASIEDECAVCHMPMARAQANSRGRRFSVFAHLPVAERSAPDDRLAHDGVSCTMCHQISSRNFGSPRSFTGGFLLETAGVDGASPAFGPFLIDNGRAAIMRSATGFRPTEGVHIRQSELCATCHTLFTSPRGAEGEIIGRLPEQVPYLEWQHSVFPRQQQSCQSCHMPVVPGEAAITSVLGTPRQGLARHIFRGGNAFMLRMLSRYRTELGVAALPEELESSTKWTVQQLQNETSTVTVERASLSDGRIEIDVVVGNRTGHKLPSGYPSRRAWLELIVRDGRDREVFHSGALRPTGEIVDNDNDADPLKYEPHQKDIREADQVQIYESVMVDRQGAVTTGLLRAVRYVKDNRLLPRGFDKATAGPDIAVVGDAADDADFLGGSDRVRYSVRTEGASGPYTIEVKLHFQPISFRWALNLDLFSAPETKRFVSYYRSMSQSATDVLGRATLTVSD